jgi:hypothetical protein
LAHWAYQSRAIVTDHDAGMLGGFGAAQEDFVGLSLHSLNTGPSPTHLSVLVLVVSFSAFRDLYCDIARSPRLCAGQVHTRAGRVPNEAESLPNTSLDVTLWLSIDDRQYHPPGPSGFSVWPFGQSDDLAKHRRLYRSQLRSCAPAASEYNHNNHEVCKPICLICLFNLAARTHLLSSQQPEDS